LGESDVERHIIGVVFTTSSLLFISSGIFTYIENAAVCIAQVAELAKADKKSEGYFEPDYLKHPTMATVMWDGKLQHQFHDSVYFVIVTLLTIGYGDINAESGQGKIVVIFIILATIMLIPRQTSELLRLSALQSSYQSDLFKMPSKHLVLSGNVQLPALKVFCGELFHPDHSQNNLKGVLLTNSDPSSEMETFLFTFKAEVTYLAGSVLNKKDLGRAMAHKATACILLTNKKSRTAFEDQRNIMNALSLKKYVYGRNIASSTD
jgi:hypothetical protein